MRNIGRIPERMPTGHNAPAQLVGKQFGKLTIIAQEPGRTEVGGYTIWRAHCECGNDTVLPSYRFLNKRYGIKSCKECAPIGRPRIPDSGAHFNFLYNNYRRAAIDRGFDWKLSRDEANALFRQSCHYCGTPPLNRKTHPNLSGLFDANGIDRIDSQKPYTIANVVPCCTTCNRAKNNSTYADFQTWLDRIVKFRS
jgi:5-methylcytosine-specific restriction endonuclease McrA